jgi:hypothetical protein
MAARKRRKYASPSARAAASRARSFVARMRLAGDRIYGALDPALAHGAFPTSPVVDWLRCGVTTHAVLALTGTPRPGKRATHSKR